MKIAQKRYKDIKFETANAQALKYKDNSFDIVIGNSILHHLNLDKALLEIKRVLKRDGHLMFCEPNMKNPYLFIQKNSKFIKKITGDSPTETAYFKGQMIKALKRNGFSDISVMPIDFLPPFTPDFLFGLIKPISSYLEKIPVIKEFSGVLFIRARA